MKMVKMISIILGLMSLSFGALKFIDPFKSWYSVQIESSGLPAFTSPLGIVTELTTGIIYLFPFLFSIAVRNKILILTLANSSLICVLTAATIVHLIPEVPASVLPLKIKPPFVPLSFLLLAILNQLNVTRIATGLNNPNNL
jgi:hypothetical protein